MSLKKFDAPPYRSPHGQWYTKQLFYEIQQTLPHDLRLVEPIFTLSPTDKPGLINCRQTFVELGDPTGYKWAMKYLGSWVHWERLLDCSWFVSNLEEWRSELDMKRTSEAVIRIREIASSDSSQALPASKYLAERGWEKKRGRPSKQEIKGALLEATKKVEEHEEDMKRIGLRVVQ